MADMVGSELCTVQAVWEGQDTAPVLLGRLGLSLLAGKGALAGTGSLRTGLAHPLGVTPGSGSPAGRERSPTMRTMQRADTPRPREITSNATERKIRSCMTDIPRLQFRQVRWRVA